MAAVETEFYTTEEIIGFIKAIDVKLNRGLSRSELDTGQTDHGMSFNMKELKEQRDRWVQIYRAKTGNDGGIVQWNTLG